MPFVNAMAAGAVAAAGLPSKPPPPLVVNSQIVAAISCNSSVADLDRKSARNDGIADGSHLVMDFADVHPNPWPTPGHAGQPAQGALGVEASTPGAYIAGHLFSTSNKLIYDDFCIMRWPLWSTHGVIRQPP